MLQNQENVSRTLKEAVFAKKGLFGVVNFVHVRAYKSYIVETEYTSEGDFYGSRKLKSSMDTAYWHYVIMCDYEVKYRVYNEVE